MTDDELDGEDRVYTDPELVEDFLQHILWPFIGFDPDSIAFLTNRSDLDDFMPGIDEEGIQQVVDAVNQRYGIAMQIRDCGRIYQILQRIRDDAQVKKVWKK